MQIISLFFYFFLFFFCEKINFAILKLQNERCVNVLSKSVKGEKVHRFGVTNSIEKYGISQKK